MRVRCPRESHEARVRRFLIATAFSLCACTTSQLSDTGIATHFLLLGTWAPTCSLPPANDNPYHLYSIGPNNVIVDEIKAGDTPYSAPATLTNLSMIDDHTLRFTRMVEKFDVVSTDTLIFSNGRWRAWEVVDPDGKVSIHKGKPTFTPEPPAKNETVWYEKCAGAANPSVQS